jgi:hypothetical protein
VWNDPRAAKLNIYHRRAGLVCPRAFVPELGEERHTSTLRFVQQVLEILADVHVVKTTVEVLDGSNFIA